MTTQKWPNRLGTDVLDGERIVGEVLQDPAQAPTWRVRTTRADGTPAKACTIDPTDDLCGWTPEDAVRYCRQHGEKMEDI